MAPAVEPMLSGDQKTAMVVNLRNEISARVDKLGLMYRTQLETLRSRLERRVNRIPNTWRDVNIMELVEKYGDESKKSAVHPAKQLMPPSLASSQELPAPAKPTRITPARGVKRPSTANEMISDKENLTEQLAVPKKRAKATTTRPVASRTTKAATEAPARSTRAASKKVVAAPEVLSPKSSNPRGAAPQARTRRHR